LLDGAWDEAGKLNAKIMEQETDRGIASRSGERCEARTDAHGGVPLKRTLSATSLMALGIGNIIGAGIFVLTGQAAAAHAGPAICLSFLISAPSPVCVTRKWRRVYQSREVPIPTPTPQWEK
jgi:amino acid permease